MSFISTTSISFLLTNYGYAIFLPLAIIEGPIVTVIAGFLASLGYFNFWIIYLLAILGDIIGDIIYYLLGRWGGQRILKRGSFLKIRAEHLVELEDRLKNHLGKAILLGKWTQHLGAPILISAGMAKVPLNKYLLFNLIGTIPKALVFMVIGYYFGQAYDRINKYFGYVSLVPILAVILVLATYIFVRKLKHSNQT